MKTFLKSFGLLALSLSFSLQPSFGQLVAQGPANITQATALTTPRPYLVVSNLFMGPKAYFGTGTNTNSAGVTSQLGLSGWITNQNVYALAPTLIPPYGAHAVGITAIIQTTNNLQSPSGPSNIVINVYPAYDIAGGSTYAVSPRYGQLFGGAPLLSWTITYTTNGIFTTNLPASIWEPATALGYTISNGITSNTTLTLLQADAP